MLRNYIFFLLASIAWIFGAIELFDVFTNFSTQWHWYVLAAAFTLTVNDIFIHRVLTHRKGVVNTKSITYKVLVFLSSIENSFGSLTNFCLLHRHHHIETDTDEDLLLPKRYWYNRNLLAPWAWLSSSKIEISNQTEYLDAQKARYANILNDPWTEFCEEYKISLTLLVWGLLFVFFPIILFKILFMGRLLMSIFMFIGSNVGHMNLPTGYKNFVDTKDDQTNNYLILHYLSLGLFCGMLHNNHHHQTATARWFELDVAKLFSWPIEQLIFLKQT